MNLSAVFIRRPVATTLLALGTGIGSELRRPLGVSIVGGLVISQVLTLYTTPVIYLYMTRLARWLRPGRPAAAGVVRP